MNFVFQKISQNRLILPVLICIVSAFSAASILEAQAGTLDGWKYPNQVPQYDRANQLPIYVADGERKLHIFYSDKGSNDAITYRNWTLDVGWSLPNEVIIPPKAGTVNVYDALLDQNGVIHLVFFAGIEGDAGYFYSNAHVSELERSKAWSAPQLIALNPTIPSVADLMLDSNNNLLLIYGAADTTPALTTVMSADLGATWAKPRPSFFKTGNSSNWPVFLKTIRDEENTIHATWSVANETGNSQAIYYSQLSTGAQNWSAPRILAEAIRFESDTPSIVKYEDELILIYHNELPTTRWMIRSKDNGATWSRPIRPFTRHVGSNGPASLIIDKNGILRVFFGNRTTVNQRDIHGMWQSVWDGNNWSDPTPVISGLRVVDTIGQRGFDPSFANTLILGGNIMFLMWDTDPGAGPNGAWFTYAQIDAPADPIASAPTVTPLPTQIQEPTPTVIPTRAMPELFEQNPEFLIDDSQSRPASTLTIGILASVIFLIGVIGFKLFNIKLR